MSRPAPLADEFIERGKTARAFLATLFPPEAAGYVELRRKCAKGRVDQLWVPVESVSVPPLARYLQNHDAGCDVWFGVALRREKGSGAARNCAEAWSLHVDADCKTKERAEAFRTQLAAFPHKATAMVATGSPFSFHVYWRLVEPVRFPAPGSAPSRDTTSLYSRTVAGLARHFGTDPTVADVARVMRLPGTRNAKPENNGTLVKLVGLVPSRVYPLAAFAEWVEPESPAPPVPTCATGRQDRDPDDPDYVDLVAEFQARGWLREDQGEGFYYVACPWSGDHSGYSGPSETALWEYRGRWHFKCQHSHCCKRRVAHVYEFIRLERLADVVGGAR